jgi:hypothetical protein
LRRATFRRETIVHVSSIPDQIRAGQPARLRILLEDSDRPGRYTFTIDADGEDSPFGAEGISHQMKRGLDFEPEVAFTEAGSKTLTITRIVNGAPVGDGVDIVIPVLAAPVPEVAQQNVALVAPDPPASEDSILWNFINLITNRMRFDEFHEFVRPRLSGPDGPEWYGTDAYRRLRQAAFDFMGTAVDPVRAVLDADRTVVDELTESTARAGVERSYVSSQRGGLVQPFLRFDAPSSLERRNGGNGRRTPLGAIGSRTTPPIRFPLPNVPFVELIWNYWTEEAHLVQTLNHILARFQNRRTGSGHDALARFDLSPLLPLRNLLWGFAEDEQRRLTVRRRDAEYQCQYGLRLLGRAVPRQSMVIERRTQFLEAYHGLLNACHAYFKERDDKTVDADAFPLLSSLREVHLVLARGANNQFADLPVTARAEMLTMQWILAQPEFALFLGGPTMVPYEEPWMDRVDTMKTLQGWPEASVTHFFELATHGEQIVLSVRHGRWNESNRTREDAANWALTWRNEIQRYIHAYRTVTGVDLAITIDATMPSTLLARRMGRQLGRV